MHNFMKKLELNTNEIELLKNVIACEQVEIIWDINAFYFNTKDSTYKLECYTDIPNGSDYEYDEIFFCRFKKLKKKIMFEKGNSKYWYKIVTHNSKIEQIEVLNVCQIFPNDELIPITDKNIFINGLNSLTLGLIIKTDKGFIPAFLLPSNHGFHWQPKFGFYTEDEIENLILENIKHFEKKNCA
jgi:hypothetical protein